jgi:succinate-semialdehyde dehydrogenase/glutarate-semialdehyde dehydrogenase
MVPFTRGFSSTATAIMAAKESVSSLLQDPSLVEWQTSISTSSTKTFEVFNPASPDSVLANNIPSMESMDAKAAIQKSHETLPAWRDETTASARASLLNAWSSLIQSNLEDLATIMTLESGKPLAESRGEVRYAASFLDYYAAEAIRPTGAGGGFLVPSAFEAISQNGAPRGQIMAMQQAVGVTALITPWNFPMAMITRKVGPALAAGCTAIVKPSEWTPLSAIALKNLADRAGLPPGVFQLV